MLGISVIGDTNYRELNKEEIEQYVKLYEVNSKLIPQAQAYNKAKEFSLKTDKAAKYSRD
jgi:hypothetical protein